MIELKPQLSTPLTPLQRTILDQAERFNVLACGRRWGKTSLLRTLLVEPVLRAGLPTAWFAPEHKYMINTWHKVSRALAPVTARKSETYKRLELKNGGSITFWAVDKNPDAGRGDKYARVVLDEFAMMRNQEKLWQEAIRPTLTDYQGDAWFASTPKGLNYFKELYTRGEEGPTRQELWRSWKLPTATNIYIEQSEINQAQLDMTDMAFRQEYMAEFIDEFGALFKGETVYEPEEYPEKAHAHTGCDFAYTAKAGDFTVFITGAVDLSGAQKLEDAPLYVTDEYRVQAEPDAWLEELKHRPKPFIFIGGQEKGIVNLLTRHGIHVRTAPAITDKRARARPFQDSWNRGLFRLPRDAPWRYDYSLEVRSFTGTPEDVYDDRVDASAALDFSARRTSQMFI